MSYFINNLLLQQWRYQFPGLKGILFQFVGTSMALVAYWFTSQAIGGVLADRPDWYNLSYFEYVIVGEIFITLPLALAEAWIRGIRFLQITSNLEEIMLNHKRPLVSLYKVSMSLIVRDVISVVFMVAVLGFLLNFRVDWARSVAAFGFMLMSLPLFAAMGGALGVSFLFWGRGQGLVSQGLYFLSLMAGTFFPISVVQGVTGEAVTMASPFAVLLETVRGLIAGRETRPLPTLGVFLVVFMILLTYQILVFARAREKYLRSTKHNMVLY